MKRIKILYAGALVALSFSSVGCNDSESDLLEPKLYFENILNHLKNIHLNIL